MAAHHPRCQRQIIFILEMYLAMQLRSAASGAHQKSVLYIMLHVGVCPPARPATFVRIVNAAANSTRRRIRVHGTTPRDDSCATPPAWFRPAADQAVSVRCLAIAGVGRSVHDATEVRDRVSVGSLRYATGDPTMADQPPTSLTIGGASTGSA